MKKLILLTVLAVCTGQMYGMEPETPKSWLQQFKEYWTGETVELEPNYMAMLPKEIKQHIIFILAQSDTIEEAMNAIRSLTETSKEFNEMINNPITIRTIIRILVQKFNAPSQYIATQLNVPGSVNYLRLCYRSLVPLWQQQFDVVEKLIQEGADIDFQPEDTYPMFCASVQIIGVLDILDKMLWAKTNMFVGSMPGESNEEYVKRNQENIEALQNMLQEIKPMLFELVQALRIKNFFKDDKELNDFKTLIHEEKFQQAFILILLKTGLPYRGMTAFNSGMTALYKIGTEGCLIGANLSFIMYAIATNDFNLLQWLIEHKANPNLFMGTGNTALLLAIELGKKEMIELLIKNGADVNQKNIAKANEDLREKLNEHDPILLNATTTKQAKVPYALLDKGICKSIMEQVPFIVEQTPLIHLLYSEQFTGQELYDLIKLLLDNGANPNLADSNGDTALLVLTSMEIEGSANSMKLLLAYGADPFAKDNEGMTALDYMKSEESEADPEREEKIQLLENTMKKEPKK